MVAIKKKKKKEEEVEWWFCANQKGESEVTLSIRRRRGRFHRIWGVNTKGQSFLPPIGSLSSSLHSHNCTFHSAF